MFGPCLSSVSVSSIHIRLCFVFVLDILTVPYLLHHGKCMLMKQFRTTHRNDTFMFYLSKCCNWLIIFQQQLQNIPEKNNICKNRVLGRTRMGMGTRINSRVANKSCSIKSHVKIEALDSYSQNAISHFNCKHFTAFSCGPSADPLRCKIEILVIFRICTTPHSCFIPWRLKHSRAGHKVFTQTILDGVISEITTAEVFSRKANTFVYVYAVYCMDSWTMNLFLDHTVNKSLLFMSDNTSKSCSHSYSAWMGNSTK